MHPFLSERPIMRIEAELADILQLGKTPYGERRIINILGGAVIGERVRGTILPGGADWQIVRPDGCADIVARYTFKTEDGALVLVNSTGLRDGSPEVLAKLARGEKVDRSLYYFRTTVRFETSHPSTDWMNRIIALAVGEREANKVKLDLYEVL